MKHGKNTLRLTALLTAALMLLLTLCGCSRGMIKEDSVHEDLPDIDPEAGIAKDMRAKLYYRLTDEAYLVGVTATITVYAGEREERAMIRTLMEGTPPLSGNISAVIPTGTEIVDVSLEGAILYVTLSAEFFNTNIVDEAIADGSRLMENGLLSRAEYEARVENAREEMYLARRLAAQSIVNTITANRPDVSVQLLFELNGSAARVRRTELGLETFGGGSHDLLEPMEFDDSYVITAPGVVACLLEHIQNGEYDKAYPLIAELEQGGAQKPDYASFETYMASLAKIKSFSVREQTQNKDSSRNLQDPGNLGTILRMGEGAGVTGVIMSSNTVDIYNPKTIRSTMGSIFRVPFVYVQDFSDAVSQCQNSGIKVYAAHLDGKNTYLGEDYREGTAFLIGNEGNGLTDDITKQADTLIRIPMQGEVESLNAAIACTILTYEAVRQRSV